MAYFATSSGRLIDLTKLSEKDIHLSDIAHGLTKICRYGGSLGLDTHYSVASHSMNLAYWCIDNNYPIEAAKHALLHDASEAYLGDIVSGLKQLLPDYKNIEDVVQNMIYKKYGINQHNDLTHAIDKRIVLDEAAHFMPYYYALYKAQLPAVEPLDICIMADEHLFKVKAAFLNMCDQFNIED